VARDLYEICNQDFPQGFCAVISPKVVTTTILLLTYILESEIGREKGDGKSAADREAQSCGGKSEAPETGGNADEDEEKAASSGTSRKIYVVIALVFLLAPIGAGNLYFLSKPCKGVLEITARRYLPDHSAPGQIFPVVIDVFIKPAKQRALLVKDGNHQGVEFVKGASCLYQQKQAFCKVDISWRTRLHKIHLPKRFISAWR